MRGGPGLGNIVPEQADIKLACRGLGHGNAIVLAPAALDWEAFLRGADLAQALVA